MAGRPNQTAKRGVAAVRDKRDNHAARARAVAQGRADIRAGRHVSPEEIETWIDTIGTPSERPVPQSRKR